jgi:chromosome segregation ATPase
MEAGPILLIILSLIIISFLMFLLSREKKKISTLSRRLQRYSKITDIEAAVVQARQEMASAQAKRVEIETPLQPLEARRTQLDTRKNPRPFSFVVIH